MFKFTKHTIQNAIKSFPGLYVISDVRNSTPIKTVSAVFKAGTRYSGMFPEGTAQLAKRMAFKGTISHPDENKFQTLIEENGGDVACELHRDNFVFNLRYYGNRLDHLFVMLTEAMFRPNLTEELLTAQKNAMLNELFVQDYANQFDEKFQQVLFNAAFNSNTLGLPESPRTNKAVESISLQNVADYYDCYIRPENLAITALNIDHETINKLVSSHMLLDGKYQPTVKNPDLLDFSVAQYTGGQLYLNDSEPRKQPGHVTLPELVYIGLGFQSANEKDQDLYPLAVLYSLLGQGKSFSVGGPGKGMYSRLNMNVLNRYYWVNSCEAFVQSFNDSGMFYIHGTCPVENATDFVNVILKQYYTVLKEPIEDEELGRAKKQLISQMLMNLEMSTVAAEDMSSKMFSFERQVEVDEIISAVEKVTGEQIKNVLHSIMYGDKFKNASNIVSVAAMGNLKMMPDYGRICEALHQRGLITPGGIFSLFK